ncbi:MAG: hypothetical protein EBS60_04510, partial [Verrucomicrobia bacterium]|nr:hypothetical protein [Verrucomicrobiota bacterium]
AFEMITGSRPTQPQELLITFGSLFILVALTSVYTSLGGIKAVVWTDLIQSLVMFAGLGFVLWHLAHSIPDGWNGFHDKLRQPGELSLWSFGPAYQGNLFNQIKGILESEYTLWTAFFAATFVTMATHGTDQDMVQRMLTAKNPARSRLALVLSGLADIPIVMAFLTIGILLWVHYQYFPNPHLPERNAHVFAFYILQELPPGVRGLLIAGIFATTMGSLSTALNEFTELPYRSPLGHRIVFPDSCAHRRGNRLGCHFQPILTNPTHRPRDFRLHLRLSPRNLSFGGSDKNTRIRSRESDRNGLWIYRCGHSLRSSIRSFETSGPATPAPPRLASSDRLSMADYLWNSSDFFCCPTFSYRKANKLDVSLNQPTGPT